MKKLTQERLKELLHYDPETGVFIRRRRIITRGRVSDMSGKTAGHTDCNGYYKFRVDSVKYLSHRLAWLYVYGYFPENDIDHINRDKMDNRISNLREVSNSCNLRNTGNYKTNTSGVKGVSFNKQSKKWYSHIVVNNKQVHLGVYNNFSNAVCARLIAEQCLNWSGCDSFSPAYKYVKKHITNRGIKK